LGSGDEDARLMGLVLLEAMGIGVVIILLRGIISGLSAIGLRGKKKREKDVREERQRRERKIAEH
jgi:uncharacterized membrane protein